MKESQRTEWKESWWDEYLKWICGFANAEGGVLVIGKNDKGTPVGVSDAKQLVEVLPDKIRDVLGIMADVRLVREAGKDLAEIRVAPYPYPVTGRPSSEESSVQLRDTKGINSERSMRP